MTQQEIQRIVGKSSGMADPGVVPTIKPLAIPLTISAEEIGFEPTVPVKVRRFSKQRSTGAGACKTMQDAATCRDLTLGGSGHDAAEAHSGVVRDVRKKPARNRGRVRSREPTRRGAG